MDPLSGVASGMAVVSLSIQLIQSVQSITAFVGRVKDAPIELIRLMDSLQRLSGLVEDVRQLIERQSSLQRAYDVPSCSILSCLHSCEKSIEPLRVLVERYNTTHDSSVCAKIRLKTGVKLALKAKEICGFEAQVRHEMQNLSIALFVNSMNIQTSIALSERQSAVNDPSLMIRDRERFSKGSLPMGPTGSNDMILARRSCTMPTALRWLGLSKQRSIHYLRRKEHVGNGLSDREQEDVVFETYDYYWAVRPVGYGLHLSQHYMYGRISPSLAVYPIVPDFDEKVYATMKHGSTEDFQRLLTSGVVHPFTRNNKGESLLHLAALEYRVDLCRLIAAHGVKPDFTYAGSSPFYYSLNTRNQPIEGPVELYRFLISTLDQIDDFTSGDWEYYVFPILKTRAGTEWFFRYTNTELSDSDLLNIQFLLLKKLVGYFGHDYWNQAAFEKTLSMVASMLDARLVDRIARGQGGLLRLLFSCDIPSKCSAEVGSTLMTLLKDLGIEPEPCIRTEIATLPNGMIKATWGHLADKAVIFERHETQGWILQWKYAFDERETGHMLLESLTALTADAADGHVWRWPFFSVDWAQSYENRARQGPKWTSRFDRRTAAKARKQYLQSGQQRPAEQMPGSWVP